MAHDTVLDQLRGACADQARPAGEGDLTAGVQPRYVAAPASTTQTSRVLRVAAEHGLRVVARGAGTKQDWALPPERVDLVLQTRALDALTEHAAGDLVAVAGAGIVMSDLQDLLAKADQQLALDTPLPGATLGGTVATATSGPRRLLYGTMRDLLIGITFVRADGVVAKAGGKVVKNVAGYDFGKLLTGSYGTLGVVTEVVVRLHPVPATRRFVVAELEDLGAAARAVAGVLASQVVPAAVEVEQPAAGGVTVAVLVEGVAAGIDVRAEEVRRLLGAGDIGETAPGWFGTYPFGPGEVGLKVTSTLSGVPAVLAAARALEVPVRGSAGGVLYAMLPASLAAAEVAARVEALRAEAARHDGHLVVLTAPTDLRAGLDVWGPVQGVDLMRRLKHQLDPGRLLAPGRFVGGI